MKHIAFLAVMFFAVAAFAQDKPVAAPEAPKAPEPMKEAAKPAPTKSAASPRKGPRRWNEDARHCLERASNTEVIKCAEEFL